MTASTLPAAAARHNAHRDCAKGVRHPDTLPAMTQSHVGFIAAVVQL